MNRTLSVIIAIQKEKEGAKRFPTFALFREIARKSSLSADELKKELNVLCREKKLRHGRTINDIYFEVI